MQGSARGRRGVARQCITCVGGGRYAWEGEHGGGQVPIFTCELHVVSMPNMNQVFVSIKNSFCHYITHK